MLGAVHITSWAGKLASDWHKLYMTEAPERAATSVVDLHYTSAPLKLAAYMHTLQLAC